MQFSAELGSVLPESNFGGIVNFSSGDAAIWKKSAIFQLKTKITYKQKSDPKPNTTAHLQNKLLNYANVKIQVLSKSLILLHFENKILSNVVNGSFMKFKFENAISTVVHIGDMITKNKRNWVNRCEVRKKYRLHHLNTGVNNTATKNSK